MITAGYEGTVESKECLVEGYMPRRLRSESDEISAGAIIQAKACDTRPTAHKSGHLQQNRERPNCDGKLEARYRCVTIRSSL